MDALRTAYLCDAVRTPIGRLGGALAYVRADDLAALPIKALMARLPRLDWDAVDEVVLGAANQSGEDNRNIGRMAALLAGLSHTVPGTTINRLCASGLDAVGSAARAIRSGEQDLVIAGGAESMTRAPYVMGKAEGAFARTARLEDTSLGWRFVNPAMKARYGVETMPETGENVARDFQVSRLDQDAFAARSQARAAAAEASGFFAEEIVAVEARDAQGRPVLFERDEHPRPGTTAEVLAGLKTLFPPDGTVTAGNAAGLNDGAAALILASEAAIERHGLTPRARILGMASAGVEPRVMGVGPIPAVRKLLARLDLAIGAFDVIELNEAFASQALAVLRGLGLPDDADPVNPHGGAIALGHPLGMTGARLALTAVHALERRGGRRALCTLCVGVGQGVALALERV
ncbi:MAG TPA: 3-oxoadipyl-CoA thiolase [Caulobacteraceae bacterium]|jgi:3-oxoadipyl-CoA thiolase